MFREVRSTYAYRSLTQQEWNWILEFAASGGPALRRYDDFQRLVKHRGVYRVTTNKHAFRHRLTIGTITSNAEVDVRFRRGKRLGTVEERFVARLKQGDVFHFAGRRLELVSVREMTAFVVRADHKKVTTIPRWHGTRMPLSTLLAKELRDVLNDASSSPELDALEPLLSVQREWSRIPGPDELLIERLRTGEGYHLFLYPFEGRFVHEGLAALLAYRLSKIIPISLSMSVTDYGIELLSDIPIPLHEDTLPDLLSESRLSDDLAQSMDESDLAKRQFREVARVAGLIFQGYPGAQKPLRHLQASASLYFDTLQRYDPENLLLEQARQEAVRTQLDISRMRAALARMRGARWIICDIDEPTPFCFPLLAERLREGLSSEQPELRIRRMQLRLENLAG
jgi:ATP-dependent Lhr-like helicase